MHISKYFLALGAAGLCIAPQAMPAQDTDAQIKAREALRQKLNELDAQPPVVATNLPVPVAKPKPAPLPAPLNQPLPAPTQQVVKPTPGVPSAPVVKQAPPAVRGSQPAPRPTLAMPPSADPDKLAQAREALRQRMIELESQPPATSPTIATTPTQTPGQPSQVQGSDQQSHAMVVQPKRAPKPPVIRDTRGFTRLEGPPSPFSPEKQQRLTALLQRYEADQVTPEQYHQQRAKILAEP
jgi:hypothetical protein